MSLYHKVVLGGLAAVGSTGAFIAPAMAAPISLCGLFGGKFCFHGAPAPVAGAGLPLLVAVGIAVLLVRRFRNAQ